SRHRYGGEWRIGRLRRQRSCMLEWCRIWTCEGLLAGLLLVGLLDRRLVRLLLVRLLLVRLLLVRVLLVGLLLVRLLGWEWRSLLQERRNGLDWSRSHMWKLLWNLLGDWLRNEVRNWRYWSWVLARFLLMGRDEYLHPYLQFI